jgi:hypothetical protein
MTKMPVIACGLALGLVLRVAGAQTPVPPGLEPMRIGPALGEPEKESIGYPMPPPACEAQPVFNTVAQPVGAQPVGAQPVGAQPVGAAAEDAEKASIGFLLSGERGCRG